MNRELIAQSCGMETRTILQFFSKAGQCSESVRKVFGKCLKSVRKVFEKCSKSVRKVFKVFEVFEVFKKCSGSVQKCLERVQEAVRELAAKVYAYCRSSINHNCVVLEYTVPKHVPCGLHSRFSGLARHWITADTMPSSTGDKRETLPAIISRLLLN